MLFTKLIQSLRCRNARSHQSKVVPAALAVYGMVCLLVIVDLSHAETLSIPISKSRDDVKELLGTDKVGLDSSDLELGTQILPFNLGTWRQSVGLRFLDVEIPPGSTISSASVQFMVDEPGAVDTSLRIYGELSPDSAPFKAVSGNVTDRAKTDSVLWNDIPRWRREGDSGPDQRTPDLTSIVQEIIDQPEWAAGNAMTFIIDPEPITDSTSFRIAIAFDKANGNPNFDPPILNVEFASVPDLVGDIDGNGAVDFADFLVLSGNFGNSAEPVGCCGDLDGSGTVDFSDFLILSANFGGANVAAAAVPEPTSVCLAMFGALGLISFRRRR